MFLRSKFLLSLQPKNDKMVREMERGGGEALDKKKKKKKSAKHTKGSAILGLLFKGQMPPSKYGQQSPHGSPRVNGNLMKAVDGQSNETTDVKCYQGLRAFTTIYIFLRSFSWCNVK